MTAPRYTQWYQVPAGLATLTALRRLGLQRVGAPVAWMRGVRWPGDDYALYSVAAAVPRPARTPAQVAGAARAVATRQAKTLASQRLARELRLTEGLRDDMVEAADDLLPDLRSLLVAEVATLDQAVDAVARDGDLDGFRRTKAACVEGWRACYRRDA